MAASRRVAIIAGEQGGAPEGMPVRRLTLAGCDAPVADDVPNAGVFDAVYPGGPLVSDFDYIHRQPIVIVETRRVVCDPLGLERTSRELNCDFQCLCGIGVGDTQP